MALNSDTVAAATIEYSANQRWRGALAALNT
jgi:hypothetical protein